MRNLPGRMLAALPDAITAGIFLASWVAPRLIGVQRIGELFMVMMLEFFVVHSSIFHALVLAMPDDWRMSRRQAFVALSVLYLVCVAVFSLGNASLWPIWTFFWLLLSRFLFLWRAPSDNTQAIRRSVQLWGTSVATYVLGAMAAIVLPLPPLGIAPELLSSLPVHGSFKAHQILAWGSLYFIVQAWTKFGLAAPAPSRT